METMENEKLYSTGFGMLKFILHFEIDKKSARKTIHSEQVHVDEIEAKTQEFIESNSHIRKSAISVFFVPEAIYIRK